MEKRAIPFVPAFYALVFSAGIGLSMTLYRDSGALNDETVDRMQRAYEKLSQGGQSVAAIAEQSGYQSEAAFRKAFKQHMGYGPGAVRRRGAAMGG